MKIWFIFSTYPLWTISNLTPLDWTTRLKARWLRLMLSLNCSLNSGLLVPFTVLVLSLWASSCVDRHQCQHTKMPFHTHNQEGGKIFALVLCLTHTQWQRYPEWVTNQLESKCVAGDRNGLKTTLYCSRNNGDVVGVKMQNILIYFGVVLFSTTFWLHVHRLFAEDITGS